MSKEDKKYQKRGVSLKLLANIIALVVFIISSALVTSIVFLNVENNKVIQSSNNYIAIKQASNDIQMASDYLTEQVRLFVANGEKKYMDAYFTEANVTKRRQKALDIVHELSEGTSRHQDIHNNISIAVAESEDLMDMEYFAMKLICVENDIPCSEYQEVYNWDISSVDPEKRVETAYHLVLGDEYIARKELISTHIEVAFEIIDGLILENSAESSRNLRFTIVFQTVLITINVLFTAGIILVIFLIVIKPMNVALHSVEENKNVTTYGNRELNYIIDAYNDIRSQNEKVRERLTYEAEHDKLTNIYNRTGYVSLFKRMRLERVIYALVDVDGFKGINDIYGHDVGDKVLVKIARTLERYFLEDNAFVFRIGGDEFAVIVENADEGMEKDIISRFEHVNHDLSIAEGAIPAITLSIGIAHGDKDDSTDTLFKKADTVLYKVKQSGKSGVAYYNE